MAPGTELSRYPSRICVRAERGDLWYRILPGRYWVRGPLDAALRARAERVFADEELAVCRGDPEHEASGRAVGPVYALEPHGPPAVPTGRVLVRFAPGIDAAGRAADLEAAGWRIERVLDYAPGAAWVRAASGRTDDALAGLEGLRTVAGVAHVEPQLLRQAGLR